ncbi:uncharacterized protein CTHT_0015410 [Thermochaetoides thermophila DSM 1495]|uniref:Uncharacterized protein n=1 Tax=Chaetomium thermophilum (strain DSM 1495 / CBS 144.50 / IMI 039719) TaxID=759272 RepID=G0S1Z6_CHATD|nr:hypothetical protein CTHT_0015410 [Thermochaetoides thermophila DSM 1495]EGS23056.1 hypothetical protein CTHT_0015410 [Thermochaetoides thermophila DSM 1495]
MFPNLTRRLAQVAKPQTEQAAANATAVTPPAAASPYKLKKVWPPDFKSMTPQQQLRFEKKYKRRLKLKMERPRWNKFVKLAQLVTTTSVIGYMVLFMDWKDVPTPFEPLREKVWGFFGIFTEENRKLKAPKDRPSS